MKTQRIGWWVVAAAVLAFPACHAGSGEQPQQGEAREREDVDRGMGMEPVGPGTEERTGMESEGAGGTGGTAVPQGDSPSQAEEIPSAWESGNYGRSGADSPRLQRENVPAAREAEE